MLCNCIEAVEAATIKKMQEKHGDRHKVKELAMQEVAFDINGKQYTFSTINYLLETINKTVRAHPRKMTVNFYHTFCPFCGTKYPKLK